MGDALVGLYLLITRRNFSVNWSPTHLDFFRYVYAHMKFHVWHVLQDQQPTPVYEGPIPPKPRLPHPHDAENKIYLEELPGHVHSRVSSRIRFTDRDRQACEYALNRILHGKKVLPSYLQRNFRVNDVQLYVGYITLLIRSTLESLKREGGRHWFGSVQDFRYDMKEDFEHGTV